MLTDSHADERFHERHAGFFLAVLGVAFVAVAMLSQVPAIRSLFSAVEAL